MMQTVLLLCCVLLSLVAAFPINTQNGALNFQPSFTETGHPSNMLSGQIPIPDPRTCQDLLHTAPSLAPLPEYLTSLALRVALEEVGCPTEAHILQLQLIRMGGKDTTETLIRESQKLNGKEGVGNTNTILRDLGESPGELRRVQRAVTLPEACTSEHGQVLYETAALIVEFAEKLPSSELITEFKTSAINVTQKCTVESWEHLEEVRKRLMKSPEIENLTMPLEDQIYFLVHIVTILKRIILNLIKNSFQAYFG
ncbi:apolipoprotein F-like [Lemur catta]|uniref:apolipoprotein F-like n=1 Tax=Lemur catta TaxID=9447 RepID=UPI001E267EB0|nr:apolipoprotein F-like [Lemur catta]XP_045409589.1 apolipoprotein F-like [Lemur catta]